MRFTSNVVLVFWRPSDRSGPSYRHCQGFCQSNFARHLARYSANCFNDLLETNRPHLLISRAGVRKGKKSRQSPNSIDVREGASGASADAPGVGLEMVSGLKLLQKDEKIWKNQRKRWKNVIFVLCFYPWEAKIDQLRMKKMINHEIFNDFNNFAISLLSVLNECRSWNGFWRP